MFAGSDHYNHVVNLPVVADLDLEEAKEVDSQTKIKGGWSKLSLPVKASFAFMLCSFLQRGISTLTTPIFTRILTTEQYGYYSIFNSWFEIVAVFTTLKLAGSVFMQALVKFEDDRDELTASTAGLGTTITLLVYCIYLPLRQWINQWLGMNTLIMTCIFAASWATLMFELWADRQRSEYKYKPLVALTIFTSIAKPLAGIIAVLSTQEYKAEARIISLVAVEMFAYTWLFIKFLKDGKTFFNKRFWKYSLSLNIPLIPHYLTRMVLNQSDRLMINAMVGYNAAGIYSLAHNLAWMLTLITNAILNSLNPWIFQRIKKAECHRIGKLSYAILCIVAICGLGLIAVAPEIVKIFAPESYYSAIWVIPPLCASVFFLFMYSLFADFEYYYEKSNFLMIASTAGGVLNIALNYFCIKAFDYIAAGYTTLFCYIFYAIAHYLCMKKIIRDNLAGVKIYNVKIILGISVGFLAAAAIMMITYDKIVIRYGIILVALLIIFVKRDKIMGVVGEIRNKN